MNTEERHNKLRSKLKEKLIQDEWKINDIQPLINKIRAVEELQSALKQIDEKKSVYSVIRNKLQASLYHDSLPKEVMDELIEVSLAYLEELNAKSN